MIGQNPMYSLYQLSALSLLIYLKILIYLSLLLHTILSRYVTDIVGYLPCSHSANFLLD